MMVDERWSTIVGQRRVGLPEGNVQMPNHFVLMRHETGTELMRQLYKSRGVVDPEVIAYETIFGLHVIASVDDGLLHLSIGYTNRLPSVEEVQAATTAFFPDDVERTVVIPRWPKPGRGPNFRVHVVQSAHGIGSLSMDVGDRGGT